MSMSVADSTVHRCESLDQKVDLLIERMSECVRFVREYMQPRTENQNMGDRVVFGVMLRDFPPCIDNLRELEGQLRGAFFSK